MDTTFLLSVLTSMDVRLATALISTRFRSGMKAFELSLSFVTYLASPWRLWFSHAAGSHDSSLFLCCTVSWIYKYVYTVLPSWQVLSKACSFCARMLSNKVCVLSTNCTINISRSHQEPMRMSVTPQPCQHLMLDFITVASFMEV